MKQRFFAKLHAYDKYILNRISVAFPPEFVLSSSTVGILSVHQFDLYGNSTFCGEWVRNVEFKSVNNPEQLFQVDIQKKQYF